MTEEKDQEFQFEHIVGLPTWYTWKFLKKAGKLTKIAVRETAGLVLGGTALVTSIPFVCTLWLMAMVCPKEPEPESRIEKLLKKRGY